MSIVMQKPVNYTGPDFQTSIFLPSDNFMLFKFVPTQAIVQPFESESGWNGKHVTKLALVDENQRRLATKTIPVEQIEGAVKASNIPNLSLWVEITTGKGENKVTTEVFNDKLKYICKAGILECKGLV